MADLELMQKKRLRELKSQYAYEVAQERDFYDSIEERDQLETLLVMNMDTGIHESILQFVKDWPNRESMDSVSINAILQVLSRQAHHLINTVKEQDPDFADFLFEELVTGGSLDDELGPNERD